MGVVKHTHTHTPNLRPPKGREGVLRSDSGAGGSCAVFFCIFFCLGGPVVLSFSIFLQAFWPPSVVFLPGAGIHCGGDAEEREGAEIAKSMGVFEDIWE